MCGHARDRTPTKAIQACPQDDDTEGGADDIFGAAAARVRDRERDLAVVKQLQNVSVSIARKVGEDDKMFGSVSTRDIADALAAQNIEIDRRVVRLKEPLRSLGQHTVEIRFSADVKCELVVNVVAIR